MNDSWHQGVEGWNLIGLAGTTYEVPFADPSPATDGDQYVYGDSDNWTLVQAGPTLAANTRYFFTVDLYPLTTGTSRAALSIGDATDPEILSERAYHPSWNPDREDFQLPEGEWTTVTVAFNTASSPATVGHETWLRIDGSRLAIDNVRVTVDDSIHDFYISSSSGSASADGFSAETAWQDFDRLAQYMPLLPGERVLLRAGDTFTQELNLRGKGTEADPIELTSYGDGPNPVIRRNDLVHDVGVVWNNASHATIRHIDVEHAKIGIYLRYEFTDFGSRDVLIEHANFRDLSDPTLEPSLNNFEYAWSDAIWVGGQAWGEAEFATRLENLTIRHVTSVNAAHLFGTGWYFPGTYKSRLKNLLIEDSVAYNNLAGSFQLFSVDGGTIRRVRAIGGGGKDTWSGTTLGFIQDSKNVLIEDSEFAYIDRAQSADGSGMDFEGNTENVTFRRNTIYGNAGSAILILGTNGPHTNLVIEDNVLYDNARDPWNSEINSEIQGSNGSTGRIVNNGIYRGDDSIHFLAPGSDWSGFTISGNRYLNFDDVQTLPRQWEFETAGDFEGWTAENQWNDPLVADGVFSGRSSGPDPFAHSPPTWINAQETLFAWIRMSQSAGAFAQLFYITETDRTWDADKSVFIPVTADGQLHDYFVNLDEAGARGVIVGLRLDPTIAGDADMKIDFVRMTDSDAPNQLPPPPPLEDPLEAIFSASAFEDGYVLESTQDSGVGGSTSRFSSTFRVGDDGSNRAYRPILSFDTSSLPDNAIIVEATIGITRVGDIVGNIPIGVANSAFGDILVDVAPAFSGNTSLSNSDWQAAAAAEGVSKFAWPAYADGMTLYSRLDEQHNQAINRQGTTQFRIRYQNDDDGDGTADYVRYASGNNSDASARPTLSIKYVMPPTTPPQVTRFSRHEPLTEVTSSDSLVFLAEFDREVTSIDPSDFVASGSTAAVTQVMAMQGTGETRYLVSLEGGDLATYNGLVGLDLAADQDIEDLFGNALPGTEPETDESFLLDNLSPTVDAIVVGEGSNSIVRSIEIEFSEEVAVSEDAFSVTDSEGGIVVVAVEAVPSLQAARTVTLTFDGAQVDASGSLVDGNYRVTVDPSKAQDRAGLLLDGNGDGTAGDNATEAFFRFYGDADGDRDVDGLDYGEFAATFLRKEGDPGFARAFDFDGDGDVDGLDYAQFSTRFLKRLSS